VTVIEAVVLPESPLHDRTPAELGLRQRYDVNLLAVARQGRRLTRRLADTTVRGGDVLLLQTPRTGAQDTLARLRCIPITGSIAPFAPRPGLRRAALLFLGAMAVTAAGLLPVQIAFAGVAALYVLFGVVPLDEVYTSIEWPVVFLIASLLPLAGALETTGGTTLISGMMLGIGGSVTPAMTLLLMMGVTTIVANVVNKAAAIIMAPIAVALAHDLGVSPDPLLMATAVGASCAFLTPVGHQVNMLVLGPGGYRFGDYWRLGLPLTIVVFLVAVPLILIVWPF
jgi:di/tricarboxylate transporter